MYSFQDERSWNYFVFALWWKRIVRLLKLGVVYSNFRIQYEPLPCSLNKMKMLFKSTIWEEENYTSWVGFI